MLLDLVIPHAGARRDEIIDIDANRELEGRSSEDACWACCGEVRRRKSHVAAEGAAAALLRLLLVDVVGAMAVAGGGLLFYERRRGGRANLSPRV